MVMRKALFICGLWFLRAPLLAVGGTFTFTNDLQFGAGSQTNLEVVGTGVAAAFRLVGKWQSFNTSFIPSHRRWFGMAHDFASDRSLLFGGLDNATGNPIQETWLFNPTAPDWSALSPSGPAPSARYANNVVFIGSGKFLLFGGVDSGANYKNETTLYDINANSFTRLSLSVEPSSRAWASAAWDSSRNAVVLFGGFDGFSPLSDTWLFHVGASSWSTLAPASSPPALRNASMAYDAASNGAILFGGNNGGARQNATYAYFVASNTWVTKSPTGDIPLARQWHSMAYDPINERVVLFGGEAAGGELSDTFMYDGRANTWSLGAPSLSPEARLGAGLVHTSTAGWAETFLFGGQGSGTLERQWRLRSRASGEWVSAAIDQPFTSSITWISIAKTGSVPTNTRLRLQCASSTDNITFGPFIGFDGTANTFYEPLGSSVTLGPYHDNKRYLKVKAFFDTTRPPKTAELFDLTIGFNRPASAVSDASVLSPPAVSTLTPTFTFNAPPDVDGDTNFQYQIHIATSSDFFLLEMDLISSFSSQSIFSLTLSTPLAHGGHYWRVRAFDGASTGAWSNTFFFFVDTVTPSAIGDLSAVMGSTASAITLTWSSPGNDGMAGNIAPGRYRVRFATFSIITQSAHDAAQASERIRSFDFASPGQAFSLSVTGLSDATTYFFSLRTEDSVGNIASLSNSPSAKTDSAPLVSLSFPSGGESLQGAANILFSASDPDGQALTLSIFLSADGGVTFPNTLASNLSGGVSTFSFNTLSYMNGSSYRIRVVATDSLGLSTSAASGNFAIANPNFAPAVSWVHPSSSVIFVGTVSVSWSVSDPNPSDTHTFTLSFSQDLGASFTTLAAATMQTSFLLNTTLYPNGTNYLLRVSGTDSFSPPLSATATSVQFSIGNGNLPPHSFAPIAPADGSDVNLDGLSLSWENKGDPNSGDSVSYALLISTAQDFSAVAVSTPGASAAFSPSGLLEGTRYFWKIRATDLFGASRESGAFSFFILDRAAAVSDDGTAFARILSGLPAGAKVRIARQAARSSPSLVSRADSEARASRIFKVVPVDVHRIYITDSQGEEIHPEISAELIFSYRDQNGDGLLDETFVPAKHLRLCHLDESLGEWQVEPASQILDEAKRKIRVLVPHFSYFTLMGYLSPATTLSSLFNFPNPFAAGTEATRIRYVLTENSQVTLKIFTLLGELVWQKEIAEGSPGGKGSAVGLANDIFWNGKNDSGVVVANGMYLCEIRAKSSSGEVRQVRKIGVLK